MTPLYLLGWLLIIPAFLVTQARFYDAHRGVHHQWRPRAEVGPTTLFYTSTERRAMLRATFHADLEGDVEKARRRYLVVVGIRTVYLALAIPLALAFGP